MLVVDVVKISVIVPIYNVRLYIERCVRSLMEQTLENIEFIFVNDCTPDDSMDILHHVLKEYPKRRKQIKIIEHETNRGISAVRNTGLKNATGQYIIYCDSDDWVEKNMYEKLLVKALETSADIVGCDFFDDYIAHSTIRKQLFPQQSEKCVKKMLRGELHCGTWNKLITKSLYERTKIGFPEGINMWEDVSTIIPLCFHATKIDYIPEALYHYIHHNTSSYTYSITEKSLENLVASIQLLESFFLTNQCSNTFGEDLCFMKLTVKLNLLLGSKGELQKKRNMLYPSANRYIFSYSCMSYYWKIALWMASKKMLFCFNVLSCIERKLKNGNK